MKLYLVNVLENSVVNHYNENLTETVLVKSEQEEQSERSLGAFKDKAIADFIVEKYCQSTSHCEVLNSNESGTSWREREVQKTFFVKEIDTEKEHISVYNIPNSYDVAFLGDRTVPVDQVRFIPGKTFEQVVSDFENSKQPEK